MVQPKGYENFDYKKLVCKNHTWVEANKFLVYMLWVWNERIDGFLQ
jgi:hypothetical protein